MRNPIVLIVDENVITSSILKRMLKPYSYATLVAQNAEDALALFERYNPDIILSDINLPTLSCFDMIEKIRDKDKHVNIAIFVNFDKRDILIEAIRFGVTQFFPKPFDIKHVEQVIKHMCNNIQESKKVRLELKRQQDILFTINNMADVFLQQTDWSSTLLEQMKKLKKASGVSALFIYKNSQEYQHESAQQILALHRDSNVELADKIYYHQQYLMRWKKSLENAKAFSAIYNRCHPTEKRLLKSFGVYEVLLMPIMVDGNWWGFLGVGDTKPMSLNSSDMQMLKTATSIIGSSINNQQNIQALHLSSSLFEHTVEGAVITDTKNRILKVNRSFTEITGYLPSEVIGKDPKMLKSGKHNKQFYKNMWEKIKTEDSWQGEVINRKKNGKLFFEWLRINAIRDSAGNIERYIAIFSDVSNQRKDERKYAHLATHDYLTTLPNRVLLNDRLEQAFAHAQRFSKKLAVLFCDLDNFKPINDTYGHSVGDELLKSIAFRLKSILRKEDTIARYGGDEFVVLIEEFDSNEFLEMTVEKIINSMSEPISIDAIKLPIRMSVGVAVYPDNATTPEALLKMADKAMYQVKNSGKDGANFYKAEENYTVETLQIDSHKASTDIK